MKFKALIILCCLMVAGFSNTAFCTGKDDPMKAFYEGNALYAKGQFSEAIEHYESINHMALESGELFFNLGNAHFRLGNLGQAIVNYQRARRLIPRDSDLLSNLKHANTFVKNPIAQSTKPSVYNVINLFDGLSVNESAWSACVLFVLASVFMTLAVIFPKYKRNLFLASIASLLLVVLLTFVIVNRNISEASEAVVISERVAAGFEPSADSTEHYSLYEGMLVNVIEHRRKWVKITRYDDKAGWIPESAINMVSINPEPK